MDPFFPLTADVKYCAIDQTNNKKCLSKRSVVSVAYLANTPQIRSKDTVTGRLATAKLGCPPAFSTVSNDPYIAALSCGRSSEQSSCSDSDRVVSLSRANPTPQAIILYDDDKQSCSWYHMQALGQGLVGIPTLVVSSDNMWIFQRLVDLRPNGTDSDGSNITEADVQIQIRGVETDSVSLGTFLIYLIVVTLGVLLVSYCLWWSLTYRLGCIGRWHRRVVRRSRLRKVLSNHSEFPTFVFDPNNIRNNNTSARNQRYIVTKKIVKTGDPNVDEMKNAGSDRVNARELENVGTTHLSCTICLDDYQAGDLIRELPCTHDFHATCIHPWFERAILENEVVCPVCRQSWALVKSRNSTASSDESVRSRRWFLLRPFSAALGRLRMGRGRVEPSDAERGNSDVEVVEVQGRNETPSIIALNAVSDDENQQEGYQVNRAPTESHMFQPGWTSNAHSIDCQPLPVPAPAIIRRDSHQIYTPQSPKI